jgi:small nuclear ribonucleoprotein E
MSYSPTYSESKVGQLGSVVCVRTATCGFECRVSPVCVPKVMAQESGFDPWPGDSATQRETQERCSCSVANTLGQSLLSPSVSFLRKQNRIRLWLYEDTRMQIEGIIIGFDEYMNFVLDEAVEIDSTKKTRQEVGRILLKGDSITMLQEAQPVRQTSQEAE